VPDHRRAPAPLKDRPTVELVGSVARKRGVAAHLAVEADVTARAAALGTRSGLFFVPPVIWFDAATGVLETERVEGFRSLMELAVLRDPVVGALCSRLGRAMALVHRELGVDRTVQVSAPVLRSEGGGVGAIHGDLTASNVGYDRDHDRLVILDWSAAPALAEPVTVGTPYFDMLWFSSFWFRTRPLSALAGWTPEVWSREFLDGYCSAGGAVTVSGFRRYALSARPFLREDHHRELVRRARGVRWLPYRVWRAMGWRRWERYLARLAAADGRGLSAA
jgi:hypothetical protein